MARRLKKANRAIVFAASLVVLFATTRADAAPTIELDTTLRRAIDEGALARGLSLELAGDIERVGKIIVTAIDGGVLVHVTVDEETRHETVLLDDTARDARVRVLALAIAELVRRRAEPTVTAPSAPTTPTVPTASSPPAAAPPSPVATQEGPRRYEINVAGGAHHGFNGDRTALRAQASFGVVLAPSLALGVALDGIHDRARDALGSAALDIVVLGGSITARPEVDLVSVELGPRLGVGLSTGAGSAAAGATARTEQAVVVTGGLVARVRAPRRSRFFGVAEAGADYVLRGVELRANDRVLLGFAGVVADALLGVGLRL